MRNAIDHGLESPEQRALSGKVPRGRIQLRAVPKEGGLEVEVEDDGRGIDWELIRARARAQGMSAESPEELVEAMFTDGITTTERPNDISGRGVGLAALRTACRTLGIRLEVHSRPGLGTTFRFSLPPALALPSPAATPPYVTPRAEVAAALHLD